MISIASVLRSDPASGKPVLHMGIPRTFRFLRFHPDGKIRTTPLVSSTLLIPTCPTPRTAMRSRAKGTGNPGGREVARRTLGFSPSAFSLSAFSRLALAAPGIGTLNSRHMFVLGFAAAARNSIVYSPCSVCHEPLGWSCSTTTFCSAGAKL